MNETLIKWIHSVQDIELPGISQNIERVKNLTLRPEIDMEEISKITELDFGLSLRLIRRINHIQSHGGRSRINSIKQGIMMFGMDQVRDLPNKLPTLESINDNPTVTYHYLKLLKQSYHAAYQARQWATMSRDEDPSEVFLATFFRTLGHMLLWVHSPDKMLLIEEMVSDRGIDPVEAQHVIFGFAINELTRELAKLWNLPSLFRESLYPENATHRRVLPVVLAVQLSRSCDNDWYSRATRLIEDDIAGAIHRDRNTTVRQIHINAVHAAHITAFIKLPHPASRLLYPAYEIDPKVTNSTELSSIDHSMAGSEESSCRLQDVYFCLAPQLSIVAKTLKRLSVHHDIEDKDVLQSTMLALHDGLGLNRVVFAILTGRNLIKGRSVIGSDNNPIFNQFSIDVLPGTLFEKIMEKPTTLWLDDHNREKLWPHIPEDFQRKICNNSFFLSSIHVNDEPYALFYADRHTSHCRLDERSYKLFKRLTTEVMKCLNREPQ